MASLRATTLTDKVVDALLDLIVETKLLPGSALPSAAELASRFDVSVVVVREAIATLSGRGLLGRRQGRETLVQKPDPEVISSMLRIQVKMDEIQLAEVQQCRAGLEVQSAVLAATMPPGSRNTNALERILDTMAQATTVAELRDADLSFHIALAEVAGNRPLLILIEALHSVVADSLDEIYQQVMKDGAPVAAITLESHRPIADAVRDGDPRRAVEAMRRHFELSLPDVDYGILGRSATSVPAA